MKSGSNPTFPDARGLGLVKDITDLGITTVSSASVTDVYYLDATLPKVQLERICRELLADPVTQNYSYNAASLSVSEKGVHDIEVAYNAGVTDPVEESVMKAIRDLGISTVKAVKTAKRYVIRGRC